MQSMSKYEIHFSNSGDELSQFCIEQQWQTEQRITLKQYLHMYTECRQRVPFISLQRTLFEFNLAGFYYNLDITVFTSSIIYDLWGNSYML